MCSRAPAEGSRRRRRSATQSGFCVQPSELGSSSQDCRTRSQSGGTMNRARGGPIRSALARAHTHLMCAIPDTLRPIWSDADAKQPRETQYRGGPEVRLHARVLANFVPAARRPRSALEICFPAPSSRAITISFCRARARSPKLKASSPAAERRPEATRKSVPRAARIQTLSLSRRNCAGARLLRGGDSPARAAPSRRAPAKLRPFSRATS